MQSGYFNLYEFFDSSEHLYDGTIKCIITPQLQTNLATGSIQMVIGLRIDTNSGAGKKSLEAFITDSEIDDCIKALKLMKNLASHKSEGKASRIVFQSGKTVDFIMTDTSNGWGLRCSVTQKTEYDRTYYRTNTAGTMWKSKETDDGDSVGMNIPLDKIDEIIADLQKAKDILTEAKRKKTAK